MLSYGLMAGLLALIVDGVYLWLVRTQGNTDEPWRIVFVAVVIAAFAIAVIIGTAVSTRRGALAFTGFAAVGLLTLAVLAGFSIGILILPSAVLAIVAAIRLIARGPQPRVAAGMAGLGALVAWGVLLAGFTLVTYAPPGCPEGGHHIEGTINEGGHVTSFTCDNGHLVSWSRR